MHYSFTNDTDQSPIDMEIVYSHIRLTSPDGEPGTPIDAELVKLYLQCAIDYIENYTGQPCLTKTGFMFYDTVPEEGFLLRYPTDEDAPIAITYRDTDDVLQTYNVANAYINKFRIPNEVKLKLDLPSGAHSIKIEYAVTAVTTPMFPIGLQAVILILTCYYYANRSPVADERYLKTINNILRQYKLTWHG